LSKYDTQRGQQPTLIDLPSFSFLPSPSHPHKKESGGGGGGGGGDGELTQRKVTYPTLDSAGGESWTRKEAEEEVGKRSEMAEMRSEVPRHAEERQKMEGQRRGNKKFASKKAALLLAWTDSADGQSVRKEAKEEDSKKPKVVEAKDAEASKVVDSNSMTIQDDHVDTGKSALAKETADREMRSYLSYQKSWAVNFCRDCDRVCSSCSGICYHFGQSST
jgi:hypothetical protein